MNSEQATFFDSQADASWADDPYGRYEAPKLEQLARRYGSLAGRTVLEPGCGTGRLTQWLARAVGPNGFVQACDISRLMAHKAFARPRGLAQVRVSHAAMENLDLEGDQTGSRGPLRSRSDPNPAGESIHWSDALPRRGPGWLPGLYVRPHSTICDAPD